MGLMDTDQKDKYEKAKSDRQQHLYKIIASPAHKKVVVAGPGTGKTFLFKELLLNKPNSLTLTFVNSLVEDLSLELCGLSEVRTLHSFARSIIKTAPVYPDLANIIREDAILILNKEINFEKIFYNREDKNEHIPFYADRLKYYSHYGYTDIVFAAVRLLEKAPDKIPSYQLVLVDEFQDFNRLEVSLIDLLGEKSPILIVGDDDQALYDFKNASPAHIRDRHSADNKIFESFTLPYCSRCTRVIVDAVNDILKEAMKNGRLKNRVIKKYLYFDHEDKDKDSKQFPMISYSQMFSRQIPWFIEDQLSRIAAEVRSKFSVLIICPIKVQCRVIAAALRRKGFRNVIFVEKDSEDKSNLKDALKLLIDDMNSNLGWRIAIRSLLKTDEIKKILKRSYEDDHPSIASLLEKDQKAVIKKYLASLRKIRDEEAISTNDSDALFEAIECDPRALAKSSLLNELEADEARGRNTATRNIPIKITTIQSSKGLADDFVFIANFDDTYLIKSQNDITDHEVCNFLVALTRTRKKAFLISSQKKEPTFLKWIDQERIERV
jgi:ATP-dependent DNA helicase UvrD/PcrA